MVFISRGVNKIRPDYGINDIYKYYKENAKSPLDEKKFKELWKILIKIIIRLIVYRNVDIALPARLGTLCARKIKSKPIVKEDGTVIKNRLGVNYKASWKKWQREYPDLTIHEIAKLEGKKPVYHLNEHTDGYKVRWKWDKFTCTVKNQSIYSLAMTRENKQELSKAFSQFNTDYYQYNYK